VTFNEPARTGPAGQHLGQRTLVTQIWYPRTRGPAGPFPLLLFAPGFLQCAGAYSDLLQAWASAGYVLAAVNFPHTNCHLGTEANEADLVNQPRDMSYVLTRLLALSARPGDCSRACWTRTRSARPVSLMAATRSPPSRPTPAVPIADSRRWQ